MFLRLIERRPEETANGLGLRVGDALLAAKVVHITGVDARAVDLQSFYEGVQEAIGRPRAIGENAQSGKPTGERWISIRYDASQPDRYRHASVAQPLHTDYAYTTDNPELALLYCARRAPEGGESIFIDSEEVVRLLETHAPALLSELRRRDVRFFKAGRDKVDRVISSDEQGTLLTWLLSCVDQDQPREILEMTARFADFVAEHVLRSPRLVAIALEAGEAVVWHDRRLLHGRHAFEARHNDDRFLWKGAIYLPPGGSVGALNRPPGGPALTNS